MTQTDPFTNPEGTFTHDGSFASQGSFQFDLVRSLDGREPGEARIDPEQEAAQPKFLGSIWRGIGGGLFGWWRRYNGRSYLPLIYQPTVSEADRICEFFPEWCEVQWTNPYSVSFDPDDWQERASAYTARVDVELELAGGRPPYIAGDGTYTKLSGSRRFWITGRTPASAEHTTEVTTEFTSRIESNTTTIVRGWTWRDVDVSVRGYTVGVPIPIRDGARTVHKGIMRQFPTETGGQAPFAANYSGNVQCSPPDERIALKMVGHGSARWTIKDSNGDPRRQGHDAMDEDNAREIVCQYAYGQKRGGQQPGDGGVF